MLGLAYHKSSSPIHRGVFLVRSVLGRPLKPPPVAVAPLDERLEPGLTTRQRVALQTRPESCQACHSMINPLGFALENYDAVGRLRTVDQENPVDASGWYQTLRGDVVQFTGAKELAAFLADSPEVHRSFVRQLFHSLVKQPLAAYDASTIAQLEDAFRAADYSIQKLIVEIMKRSALGDAG